MFYNIYYKERKRASIRAPDLQNTSKSRSASFVGSYFEASHFIVLHSTNMGYSLGKEFILLTPKCNEDMLFDPLLVNYFLENLEVLGLSLIHI